MKVIFDSSFLMAVAEHPTTWFEDMVEGIGKFEPVLLECVSRELEKLASGQGRRARAARVSLDMSTKFSRVPCGRAKVDDEIASAALGSKGLVATADAELIRALKSAHVGVISLSGGRVALP